MEEIFGKVTPPGPFTGDPTVEAGRLIATAIRIVLLVAGFFFLVYLILGAFSWITSSGDKEKLSKARDKMVHAIVGLLVLFAVIGLWALVTGDILGIIKIGPGGWQIPLPSF